MKQALAYQDSNAKSITGTLPVMEIFTSIQGEGFHTGRAASFLRLAGCDVGCVWCDVKKSWDAGDHNELTEKEIISSLKKFNTRNLVLTGGEPLLYNLDPITEKLKNEGFNVWLETSGSSGFSGTFDWVVVSPKKFKAAREDVLAMADELKIVIYHKSDLEWALQYKSQVPKDCLLYLQPEWSRKELSGQLISEFIKDYPEWRISQQTHKYLNLP